MSDVTVSELAIYPVKSCGQIQLQKSRVEAFGLQYDRRWMVVDEQDVMLTQRKIARMCLIQVKLTPLGILLNAPGMKELRVNIPEHDNKRLVTVWQDQCQSYDAGEEATDWLGNFLKTGCRLVYFPDNEVRQVDPEYAMQGDKTAFSDGFPLLLISQASLDDLNHRLASPISMARFRPNLVVKGCEKFAEDNWKKIRIGEIEFRIVKPCSRCVIPSINIETAEKEEEPTKTLVSYRKRDNKIFFGQNVIASTTGEIQLGMPVEVIE